MAAMRFLMKNYSSGSLGKGKRIQNLPTFKGNIQQEVGTCAILKTGCIINQKKEISSIHKILVIWTCWVTVLEKLGRC